MSQSESIAVILETLSLSLSLSGLRHEVKVKSVHGEYLWRWLHRTMSASSSSTLLYRAVFNSDEFLALIQVEDQTTEWARGQSRAGSTGDLGWIADFSEWNSFAKSKLKSRLDSTRLHLAPWAQNKTFFLSSINVFSFIRFYSSFVFFFSAQTRVFPTRARTFLLAIFMTRNIDRTGFTTERVGFPVTHGTLGRPHQLGHWCSHWYSVPRQKRKTPEKRE